ncbi:MAG: hypothetical protein RIF34_06950 [Candidatus Kapaibacterium sp.]
MKEYRNILIALGVSLFLLTICLQQEVKAQTPPLCKDGVTPASSIIVPVSAANGPGCVQNDVTIYYCCDYNATTGRIELQLIGAGIYDLRCFANYDLSSNAFWTLIREALIEGIMNDPNAPCHNQIGNITSCDNPTYYYDFSKSTCHQVIVDETNQTANLISCGEGFCEETYKLCRDYSVNPSVLVHTKISGSGITESHCINGPLLPWDGSPLDPDTMVFPYDYISPCVYSCGQ